MIDWKLDSGCAAVVGFGVPHDLRVANREGGARQCQWRPAFELDPASPRERRQWLIRYWHYVCHHYRYCLHCHQEFPLPARECEKWEDRPSGELGGGA